MEMDFNFKMAPTCTGTINFDIRKEGKKFDHMIVGNVFNKVS